MMMRQLIFLGLCGLITGCSHQINDGSVGARGSSRPVSGDPILAKADLIRIDEVDPSIRVVLQYKGPTAFSKKPLYGPSMPALLRPETAVRLRHANRLVKPYGYRIQIWDAYRPPSAQIKLYKRSGHNDLHVANPDNAPSQHSCGTAVDVTLVRANGKPVPMPTGFDSIAPEAASSYVHRDPEVRRNLKILQSAMSRAGFYPLPAEWWHYIDINYQNYPGTIPLSALKGSY